MGEGALLGLHRLQAGFLVVDLVLDAEQVTDRARVRKQGAELGDRCLVRGDLAVHVGHLLGDVLSLLLQGKLGAETAGQLAERGRVRRDRDLQLHAGRGLGRVIGIGGGRLARDVTAHALGDLGGLGGGRTDVIRPHGQLRGVDDAAGRGQPGRGARAALTARSALGGGASGRAGAAAGTPWPAAVFAPTSDELAALLELALLELAAEHPARNMPPPSRTLPIMRPTTTPCLVRPVRARRRVKLRVFSMPL